MTKIKFREFPDLDSLSIAAVKYFLKLHSPQTKQTFLVPGGQTPSAFYRHLFKSVNDWSNTTLMLSDERLVPEENVMSNVGMVKKIIRENSKKIEFPNLVENVTKSIYIDPGEIIDSVNNYVTKIFPLTAAFLGIGVDGHTASIFPGFENYPNNSDPLFLVKNLNEPFSRISISADILINVPQIFFLVSGSSKKLVMKKIRNIPQQENTTPVQKIINQSKGEIIFLCDAKSLAF